MTEQTTFPGGPPWNVGPPDLTGYEPPPLRTRRMSVTVVGTVKDEQVPFNRSWSIWSRQQIPDWLEVEHLVLDDGSDEPFVAPESVRSVRMREPGGEDRSCTLAFNVALRQLVQTDFVIFQWWDRIPGSFTLLRRLMEPHRHAQRLVTSMVTRHIGASSSLEEMTPQALAARMALVPWQDDPGRLADISGPIGGHCIPGQATESAGMCVAVDELVALGGWDERYVERSSYVNVELWRRMLQAGLVARFVPEPWGACYHQSHASGKGREKTLGWLSDRRVRRNQGDEWGVL